MMLEYLLLLLIPVLSWLDRQRGAPKEEEKIGKFPALMLMGYSTAILTGHWFDWQAVVITCSFAFLHNTSFGQPVGESLTGKVKPADDGSTHEEWQVGVLKNCWLALAARGAFLGVAGWLALDLTAGLQIALAWAIAFPLSAAVIRYIVRDRRSAWARMEYLRGGLAAGLMAIPAIL